MPLDRQGSSSVVWAYESLDDAPYHLLYRRGAHVSLCGRDLRYADTRYAEERPLNEERICARCVEVANNRQETYP